MKTTLQVEVFRAGDYGPKGVYTHDDLDRIAADYDTATHEAPVTLDHEQKGPAHGWVSALSRLGERLVATITRIGPGLAESLRSGAFKKRSIELYRAFPNTGRPYLKAVSFLGAAAPEVKGLADPAFVEAQPETVTFEEAAAPTMPARDIRAELIGRAVWRPEWEGAGVLEIFQLLGDSPESDALMEILAASQAPVSLGETAIGRAGVSCFAESLHGGETAESRNRHRAAMALIQCDPAIEYRDALLRAR